MIRPAVRISMADSLRRALVDVDRQLAVEALRADATEMRSSKKAELGDKHERPNFAGCCLGRHNDGHDGGYSGACST